MFYRFNRVPLFLPHTCKNRHTYQTKQNQKFKCLYHSARKRRRCHYIQDSVYITLSAMQAADCNRKSDKQKRKGKYPSSKKGNSLDNCGKTA